MTVHSQELAALRKLISAAQRKGADAADAVLSTSDSLAVRVRNGRLESSGNSESSGVSLRVFIGRRQAFVSSTLVGSADVNALVERAVSMARNAPEDPYAELVPVESLARGPFPDLDMIDTTVLSADDLLAKALEAEAATLNVKGVSNSGGSSAESSGKVFVLATSNGFEGVQRSTRFSISSLAYAGGGNDLQVDYDHSMAVFAADLGDPAQIGKTAGERAVARLGGVEIGTGKLPVVFDRRVSNSLLSAFSSAISGASVAMGTSFLKDYLGEPVFAAGINVIDDPLRPRALGSQSFDGEGVATRRSAFVCDGVLNEWMLDHASALQLELQSNGHARRDGSGAPSPAAFNLYLEAGDESVKSLLADVSDGFYVTKLVGQGVNGITGDYSRGASGFRIVNGRLAEPIGQATIASNLKDMFLAMLPADDLKFEYGINAPTLRVDGMTVAGR